LESGEKDPHVVENPMSDDQIKDGEEIKPKKAGMVERPNPSMTPNGSGRHPQNDEDNGWVVPIDQLSKSEKAKIEDTKL